MPRLEYLDDIFGHRVNLLHSNPDTLTEEVRRADVLVGAVLVAGRRGVPVEIVSVIPVGAVLRGVGLGVGLSLAFALPALSAIWRVAMSQ